MTQRASASITVDPRAYFGCSFTCPERTEPLKIDGNLKEWGEACHIPDLVGLTAVDAFGEVPMAWGDAGLWLAGEVDGESTLKVARKRVGAGKGVDGGGRSPPKDSTRQGRTPQLTTQCFDTAHNKGL